MCRSVVNNDVTCSYLTNVYDKEEQALGVNCVCEVCVSQGLTLSISAIFP